MYGSIFADPLDHTARSRDSDTRRRYARFEGCVGQAKGRSGGQVECHFPQYSDARGEEGVEKSVKLKSGEAGGKAYSI